MGRSILAVLLATTVVISRVSNNPTPVPVSHCLSSLLHAVRCCLAAVSKGEGAEGHWVNKGRAKPLSCSKLTVTEVRC